MAFRKTVRSHYLPNLSHLGFGEVKFDPSSSGSASRFLSRSFVPADELAMSALPLISLDAVLSSGSVIDGRVSFAPSDPAIAESRVNSALSDYISNNPVESVSDEN